MIQLQVFADKGIQLAWTLLFLPSFKSQKNYQTKQKTNTSYVDIFSTSSCS